MLPGDSGEVPEDRKIWINVRETAAAARDRALEEREELVRLRELALDARREAEDARAEREHLLGQLREANEKLVTAIVDAQQLADLRAIAGTPAQDGDGR